MAYDIGTARGVIEMEYNGRGIDKAKEDLQGLDDSGKKAGYSMEDASRKTGRAGLVIAAGLGLAVSTAANFEQRMSAVEAVSGATSAEMDKLSDKALDLGAKTSFSAGEAASAMEELVKAGLTVDDVLNGAADATVALAAAGEVSLPEAAAIASNAMNQFNLDATKMPKVADLIAGAANRSAIDVSDFGQSLAQAGAVANLAGVDFEDTATAIALMGNAGIKGSDAGTSLKSMLMRLQPTTKKQSDLMKELGIMTYDLADANKTLAKVTGQDAQKSIEGVKGALAEYVESQGLGTIGTVKNADAVEKLLGKYGGLNNAFYDAKGNTKGLAEISGVLAGSLKGMSKEQKQAALNTLFGSDAIRAAAIMADAGSKGFNKLSDSMKETKAADVAKTRLDNFKGSLEAFMGSLETAGITLGAVFLPPLRRIVEALTQVVNWFANLSSGQQKALVGVLAFVAGALLVISTVMKIIIFIGKFQATLVALRGTMIATWAAALGPIALVIAAVAAIVLIIILLWKKSETFRNIVLGVWEAIKAGAAAVASWFTGTFLPALTGVWNSIVSVATTVWNALVSVIRTVLNVIVTLIATWVSIITAPWRAMWALFGPIVKASFGLVVAIVRLVWTVIKGLFILGARFLINNITQAWNMIRSITSAVWNAIKAAIASAWNAIKGVVMPAVNAVKTVISTAWSAVKSKTSEMWNNLKTIISSAITAFMGPVNDIKEKVLGAFDFAGEMFNKGKEIIQGLIDGITSMIGNVTDAINSITDKIGKFLPGSPVKEGPLRKLNRGHAGKEIVEMVIRGIDSMAAPLASTVSDVVTVPLTSGASEAPLGRVKRKGGSKKARRTLVAGDLALVNGRAYISGVAEDVFDNFNGDNSGRG